MFYRVWVDDGEGWFVIEECNHWPTVEKYLDEWEYAYYEEIEDEEE